MSAIVFPKSFTIKVYPHKFAKYSVISFIVYTIFKNTPREDIHIYALIYPIISITIRNIQ